MSNSFEQTIHDLTLPINGQYPRPWMTELDNPEQAKLFIVGLNQATAYPESTLSHERHMDALFNRNGESSRNLYDEIRSSTGRKLSPTRRKTDKLSGYLRECGITDFLETDVICYSTKKFRDLKHPAHQGGKQRGEQIFRQLIDAIRPPFLISHGVATTRALANILCVELPRPAATAEKFVVHPVLLPDYTPLVFIIPSLTPRPNIGWTTPLFERLANEVAASYISYLVLQKIQRTTAEKIKCTKEILSNSSETTIWNDVFGQARTLSAFEPN